VQVDTDRLPPRVAQIIELIADNARTIAGHDSLGIHIDCSGGNVRLRAHPAPPSAIDVKRSIVRRT
jgi:hypothetical protein